MANHNRIVTAGLRMLRDVVRRSLRSAPRRPEKPVPGPRPGPRPRPRDGEAATPRPSGAYPGDFTGRPTITYTPVPDGRPDPGEIVWTWVPYEEDHSQGKDRPALIIGRDRHWLLGLQVTSQDHDRDAAWEASQGRHWVDIGTGPWDSRGRESEVRVNRLIRLDPDKVRRIGAILDKPRFDAVAREVLRHY